MVEIRPKVSVGIPVYNGEKFLAQALDSILPQTFTDFEIIIADNASSDRTREICLQYEQKDKRIRYYRNNTNVGAAPNHNLLVDLAKGEYFKWAAYDDRIAPEFLSRCVEILDTHPDVVLCLPMTGRIDEHGNYLGEDVYVQGVDEANLIRRFSTFALHSRTGSFNYGLMRASTLSRTSLHGSFPSSDLVFQAELALYGRFYIVPEILFFRRSHPAQSTKGSLSKEWARRHFFDTSLKGRILLPKWLSLFSLLRAVKKAPLNRLERLKCNLCLIQWIFIPRNLRGMIKDLIRASIRILARTLRRKRSRVSETSDIVKGS